MSSIPRRLRKISFLEQDTENVELNEEGLQGPPEIDNILPGLPHESTSPIKIIWPNGDMRQIVGVWRSQFLSNLKGGKIIVGTDHNGVPNESHVKVSQGMTFVEEPEQDKNVHFKLRAIGDNVENMQDEFQMMRAFIAKKFPGEDYRNVMEAAENNEIDLHGTADDTNIQHEISSDIQESARIMCTSSKTSQELLPGNCTRIKVGCANSSLPHEDRTTKDGQPEIYAKEHLGSVPREQQLRLENYSKESYGNSSLGRRRIIAMKANNENSTEADKYCDVSSFPHKQPTNKDKFEVYLFSANPRNKNKVVAIGTLMSQDKTNVVGGNMLGEEYCGVLIKHPTEFADEKLPRPYKDIQTVRDALGHVIAWPRFNVKRKKSSSNQKTNNLVNRGAK